MTETTERNGLEIAENVSVVGSLAGAIVASVNQQLIWMAAAPLCVALGISIINRRRFEQTLQQNMTVVLSEMATRVRQVDQQLTGEIESVRASVQGLSPGKESVGVYPIQGEISQLQKRFDNLEKTIISFTSTSKREASDLTVETNSPLTAETVPAFDPTYLEQQIRELKEVVNEPKQSSSPSVTKEEVQQLQNNLTSLTEAFNQRIDQVRQITSEVQYHLSTLPPTTGTFDPTYLEQQIRELKATIAQNQPISYSDQTQVEKPNLPPIVTVQLEAEIQNLKAEVQSLQEQLKTTNYPAAEIAKSEDKELVTAAEIDAAITAQTESVSAKMKRLGECIAYHQQKMFGPKQFVTQPEVMETIEVVEEIQPTQKKLDATLTNWTETVVSRLIKAFENSPPKEKEMSEGEELNALLDEIKNSSDEELGITPMRHEGVVSQEAAVQPSAETKTDSLEALIALAREHGVAQQFQLVIAAAREHNLTLNPWPTNLMVSPAAKLLAGAKSNSSQCLFIVSAQPTEEGKVKLWLSSEAFAEFYPLTPQTVASMLGDDGWYEMDKEQIEAFVANLDRLFEGLKQPV